MTDMPLFVSRQQSDFTQPMSPQQAVSEKVELNRLILINISKDGQALSGILSFHALLDQSAIG